MAPNAALPRATAAETGGSCRPADRPHTLPAPAERLALPVAQPTASPGPATHLELPAQLPLQHHIVLVQSAALPRRRRQQPVEAPRLGAQGGQGLGQITSLALLRLQPAGWARPCIRRASGSVPHSGMVPPFPVPGHASPSTASLPPLTVRPSAPASAASPPAAPACPPPPLPAPRCRPAPPPAAPAPRSSAAAGRGPPPPWPLSRAAGWQSWPPADLWKGKGAGRLA